MLLIELTPNYGGHLAISGLPEKIHIMASNLYMNMRPPAPPVMENLPGDGDRFHPAVKKSSSLDLSPLTSEKFAAARLNVTNAIEKELMCPKALELVSSRLALAVLFPANTATVGAHTFLNFFF